MNLFIVSHNPLFSEVLSEMLRPNLALEIFCVDPEMAQEAVLGICPEVIFIDQAISPELRIQIMEAARSLQKSKVILLTASENDYILIRSENLTFTTVDDLIRNLQNGTIEATN